MSGAEPWPPNAEALLPLLELSAAAGVVPDPGALLRPGRDQGEADTLVARTNGLRDGLWLDMSGTPLTDAATLTERITRPNYGTLDIAFTVDDPKAYTRAWTVNLRQEIVVDTDLIEEICLEGLRPMHLPPQ